MAPWGYAIGVSIPASAIIMKSHPMWQSGYGLSALEATFVTLGLVLFIGAPLAALISFLKNFDAE